VYYIESQLTFQRNISPPSSGSKNKLSRAKLATCFHTGFLLGLFLSLKMEAICSYKTSVDFQRTPHHYISEDSTLVV
jgi:hypothetical protein